MRFRLLRLVMPLSVVVAACTGGRRTSATYACTAKGDCLEGLVCASDGQCRSPDEEVPLPPVGTCTFAPASGLVGSRLVIRTRLAPVATGVTLGGAAAVVLSRAAETLEVLVMPGTNTGAVKVTTPEATAVGALDFEVRAAPPPTRLRHTLRLDGGIATGHALAIDAEGALALIGEGGPDAGVTAHAKAMADGVFETLSPQPLAGWAAGPQPVAVALSADGRRALVGDGTKAQVFTREGDGGWAPDGAPLEPVDAVGDPLFGVSVGLSADGTTAAVGGPSDDSAKGATWVFVRTDGAWQPQGPKLIGVGGRTDAATRQGNAVALDATGDTLVVGGSGAGNTRGAAWVFTRANGGWVQRARLSDELNTGAPRFGASVALSADGATLAIGGPVDAISVGAVWVYRRAPDDTWVLDGEKLTPGGRAGSSVSLSADATRLLVGCPRYNSARGRALLYQRDGGGWSAPTELSALDARGAAAQASVVVLSLDGLTALVSGVLDDSGSGAVWTYRP